MYHICLPYMIIIYDTHIHVCVLLKLQEAYDEHCVRVRRLYTDDFWRVFSSVYTERAVIIDRVLRTCRDVYVPKGQKRKRFEVTGSAGEILEYQNTNFTKDKFQHRKADLRFEKRIRVLKRGFAFTRNTNSRF